jgi:hypothetical protein
VNLRLQVDFERRSGFGVKLIGWKGDLRKLFAHMPKYVLVRNDYGFTASEMKKNAQKLHGKAKQRIASGRSKEFRRLIEEVL